MTTLDLTLKPYENLLNGIVMYEPINRPLLGKLIHSDLLKETFRNPFVSFSNEKTQLEAYRNIINSAGYAVVSYNKTKNNPFGRCNPAGSLVIYYHVLSLLFLYLIIELSLLLLYLVILLRC